MCHDFGYIYPDFSYICTYDNHDFDNHDSVSSASYGTADVSCSCPCVGKEEPFGYRSDDGDAEGADDF